MKTVAGFFNALGGALLIGVSDSREAFGLERDIATLHERKSTDGYEQFLRNLLIKAIGAGGMQPHRCYISRGEGHRDLPDTRSTSTQTCLC